MNKKNKKLIVLIFISTFIMFIMTGCTRQEYSVNINDSNTVDFSAKVLISKESYDLISSFGIDINELEKEKIEGTGTEVDSINALFQETAMIFNKYGFKITALDDAVETGFIAKKTYLTIDEFNNEIKQLCENNLCGLNLEIECDQMGKSKTYKAYGTLDYVVDKDMGFDDSVIKKYFDEQYDSSNMTATAYIFMPLSTKVTNSDGQKVDSNGSIAWTTTYSDGQKEVHVISSYQDNTLIIAISFISIIIFGIIVFFLLRALKFKKEKNLSALSDEYKKS